MALEDGLVNCAYVRLPFERLSKFAAGVGHTGKFFCAGKGLCFR